MAYKWKPNKSQRKAFALRMQDPQEREAYEERKKEKANKRRASSKFDYNTAGGRYVPTKTQNDIAFKALGLELTQEEQTACDMVMSAYSLNEKTHHDFIHIVNELVRSGKIKI